MATQASDNPAACTPAGVGGHDGSVGSSRGSARSNGSFEVITPPSTTTFGSNGGVLYSRPQGEMTLDQAVERVNNLTVENTELREYLKENNTMMESQYQTMLSWKDRIRQSNQFNKEKAEEAKALIQQLRAQNEGMQEHLKQVTTKETSSQKMILSLRQEVQMLQKQIASQQATGGPETMETVNVFVEGHEEEVKKLQQQCSMHQDQVLLLENEKTQVRKQLEHMVLDLQTMQNVKETIQRDLKAAQYENQMLKQSNQNLSEQCSQLESKIVVTPNDISLGELGYTVVDHHQTGGTAEPGVQILREKVQLLATPQLLQPKEAAKSQMNQTVAMNVSPTSQASNDQNYDSDVQGLKSQVLTLINEIHDYQTKVSAATRTLDQYKAKCQEWEKKFVLLEEESRRQHNEDCEQMNSLKNALQGTEQTLKSERADNVNTKQQLHEVRTSFQNLFKDYNDLLQVANQRSSQVSKEVQPDNKLKQLEEEKDRLTAQVFAAEEAIAYREEQIKDKCLQYESLKKELETIPVLKAQAEVFKVDFEAERKAREQLHAEKEKIIQDMHNLQIQNQQLLDEMEKLSKRQLMEMQQRHAPGSYSQTLHNYLQIVGPNQPVGFRGYNYDSLGAQGSSRDSSSVESSISSGQSQSKPAGASQHDESEHPIYNCPKCDLQCPDVDTLQIHVMDCIDQN